MGNRSFLKRILATYLCIMIIPMIFGVVAYEYILSKNTEKVINVLEDSFQNNVDGITDDLNSVESTVDSISFNPEFSRYFYNYLPDKNLTTTELLNFRKTLGSYHFDKNFIDEVFMYSKHLDTLINYNNIYLSPVYFFQDYYRVKGESFTDSLNRITNGNAVRFKAAVKVENEYVEYPVIELQKPVPIVGEAADGFITVLFKADNLFSSFKQILKDSGGNLNVFYEENLVYSGGKEPGNEKMHSFTLSPENTKWRYELAIPYNYIMRDNRTMNIALILVNTVAFIIGSFLCVYFAMKKVRAYEKIILKMDLVGDGFEEGKGDEIEKIDRFISEIMKNKDEAEQELLEQKRIGDTYDCIYNLLYGGYNTHEDAQYAVNENGVVFAGDKYSVVLISFENGVKNVSDEISVKEFLQPYLAGLLGDMVYSYYINSHDIAVVVSFDGSETDFCAYLKNIVSAMKMDLVYKYDISVHIGVGGIVTQLNEIAKSLKEADDVIKYVRMLGEDKTVLYSELPLDGDDCSYSAEIEEKLIKSVRMGEEEKAVELLYEVKEKNIHEKTLSPSAVKKLHTLIGITMMKINEKAEGENDFVFDGKSLAELFDYAAEYVKIVSSTVKLPAEKRSDALHSEIVEYVNKNFADSELSLEKLSARFNLNVAYTSTVFRKKTGDTFLHYVEKLRIEKACEMILSSEYKITVIAEKTGYTNDTSFRRSFKRITGLSPSQYYSENIAKK